MLRARRTARATARPLLRHGRALPGIGSRLADIEDGGDPSGCGGVSGKEPRQARRDVAPPSSAESRAAELGAERRAGRVPDEMRGVGHLTVFEAGGRKPGG
jgi:hypothetical protein